jgi:hypothetical protein
MGVASIPGAELNAARLHGTSYHIVHPLIDASLAVTSGVSCFFLSLMHIHLPVPCSRDRYR